METETSPVTAEKNGDYFLHREILKKPKPQLCEKKKRYCIRTVPPDMVIPKNIEDFQ